MTTTVRATYDGKVLCPVESLPIAPNSSVLVTIESPDPPPAPGASFLQTARSIRLNGPRDWSSRLEDYLYGDRSIPDA